jgi:hypothetical protein
VDFVTEKCESKACCLCNRSSPSTGQRGVKRQKTAIQIFTVFKTSHGTIRKEQVDDPECGVSKFCFPCKLQFPILEYRLLNILHFGQLSRTNEDM